MRHLPHEPPALVRRKSQHGLPFVRNLEKDPVEHQSLWVVAHPVRLGRLGHEHRPRQERIARAERLEHQVATHAERDLHATGMHMLLRSSPRGLEVAQPQHGEARHAVRPQVKRPALLAVDIDYRVNVNCALLEVRRNPRDVASWSRTRGR